MNKVNESRTSKAITTRIAVKKRSCFIATFRDYVLMILAGAGEKHQEWANPREKQGEQTPTDIGEKRHLASP